MRETIGPGLSYTLEDIIRRKGAQKPTAEMLEGLALARNIMEDHKFVQVLGLKSLDSILLHAFITEKVIGTRLYDLEWVVHSPGFSSTPKQVTKDDLRRSNLQTSLERLVLERDDIIEESYKDIKSRLRVRNLELAANDLVARGSVYVEGKQDPYTEIKISDELFDSWALWWGERFVAKRGHIRRKTLRYKNS
jgi:hypothetical protein